MEKDETLLDKIFGCAFIFGVHCEINVFLFMLLGVCGTAVKVTSALGAVLTLSAYVYANRESFGGKNEEGDF